MSSLQNSIMDKKVTSQPKPKTDQTKNPIEILEDNQSSSDSLCEVVESPAESRRSNRQLYLMRKTAKP
jgi:hypothetical protein